MHLKARIRDWNSQPVRASGSYVLYWMQLYRRFRTNHALDYAIECAESLGKPLVVYEGLKLDYRWSSARHSQFLIEGMRENAEFAREHGLNYWPFVEGSPDHGTKIKKRFDPSGRGLLRWLSESACLVVTDDYPAFIVPEQTSALASKVDVAVHAIDGNSILPLSALGPTVSAAAHLRPRIHKAFATHWPHRAILEPVFSPTIKQRIEPPFPLWNHECDLPALVKTLPIDQTVPALPDIRGGSIAGREVLQSFIRSKLKRYADERSQPDDPDRNAASGISPWLRNGHIGIQEVVECVLNTTGNWSPERINIKSAGKREGFYCDDDAVNSFLDEAITWRDVGYHWHYHRGADIESLARSLPPWALQTLRRHERDPRTHIYTLEEFEAGATHDPLWNAAQRELVATGRIHNYLRMLWGKKVLEWSSTPDSAYEILEHLNNKYAIDGRDPNSYTGILWCFGLFDRPWPPERNVYGTIRYMSSDNTAKKFKLASYHEYIKTLPTIAQVRAGRTTVEVPTLF